jgi:hypothetical protein
VTGGTAGCGTAGSGSSSYISTSSNEVVAAVLAVVVVLLFAASTVQNDAVRVYCTLTVAARAAASLNVGMKGNRATTL